MRNLIIVSLLFVVFLAPLPSYAQATTTQEQVNAQLVILINSLMEQVKVLMAKLIEIEAQRAVVVAPVIQTIPKVEQATGGVPEVVGKRSGGLICSEFQRNEPNTVNADTGNGYSFMLYQLTQMVGDIDRDGKTNRNHYCPTNQTEEWIQGCQKAMEDNAEYYSCLIAQ